MSRFSSFTGASRSVSLAGSDDNATVTSSLDDRLLAEAVRVMERDPAVAAANDLAFARHADEAPAAGDDLEQRVIARAASLPTAASLREASRKVRTAFRAVLIGCLILALLAGAGAARAALGGASDRPVNFFWALGTLLGLQTVLLLIWALLVFIGARGLAFGSLGSLVVHLAQVLARRLRGATFERVAALQAAGAVLARPAIASWTFSVISHSLWTSFNIGCVIVLALLLSTRRYTFIWETTILDAETYQRLTELLATAPRLLGFTTPSPEQVAATMIDSTQEGIAAAKNAWSGLLLGSIVAYGLIPRAALALICWVGRTISLRRYRLDLLSPGFQRLAPLLTPSTRSLGVVDSDEGHSANAIRAEPPLAASRPTGPPAILGLEIAPPRTGWPPRVPLGQGTTINDLGLIDDRDAQQRVVKQLRTAPTEPASMIIVASLTTTPDRGIAAFMRELGGAVSRPLSLALTGGQSLRERGGAATLGRRIADWRQLALDAGVPGERVLEIDLDHLTEASQSRLATLIDAGSTDHAPPRRLERAFNLIADHVPARPQSLDPAAQVELHQSIARLYRSEQDGWRKLIAAPASLSGGDLRATLERAARNVTDLLPQRLRVNPRWLAAGAAAGALGCIAAASLVSPAAIAVLPMWSAIGAAIGTAVNLTLKRGDDAKPPVAPQAADWSDAVRSAALLAMLLELQGRGEAAITRVLDRAINDDKLPAIVDASSVRAWLDELRHRFDMALAAEGLP